MNTMDNYLIPVIPFHEQILTRGEGSFVYDTKGDKYLDLNSGQFCTVLGHSNPELVECVKNSSSRLVHTSSGMISDSVLKVSKQLNEISGRMDARSILLSTGAEAVEFAIRYAKHLTGREGLVCFEKGYHGLTLGTQSITFGGRYTAPHVEQIFSIPVPSCNDYDTSILALKNIIDNDGDAIAAVVLEPIVSVGGMIFPEAAFFQKVSSLCKSKGILLVFDESQTGFGRTGSWFCYQEYDVIPDMVICSKGIGMGYPVSAVLFRGGLCEENHMTMTHYSSHQNDPFAASIISFGIDYIERNHLLSSNKEKGIYFLDKLKELSKISPIFTRPRGHGMMLGLDIEIPGVTNYRTIYQKVYDLAAQKRLLIQGTDGGRVLRFLPDYLISHENIDFCINVLGEIKL